MKTLLALLLLIPSLSWGYILCEKFGDIGKHDDLGILKILDEEDRKNLILLERKQLNKILNKIPRPSPEEIKWIEGEIDSNDTTRYLNLLEYKIYTQYINIRRIENRISILDILENWSLKQDKSTQHEWWLRYIVEINDYIFIQDFWKLYEKKILKNPENWILNFQVLKCMRKSNEMSMQVLEGLLK